MYLSVHATAGALIGSYVNQSGVAFCLGFISHFVLDLPPHREMDVPMRSQTAQSIRQHYLHKIIGIIYLDISLFIIVAAALFTNNAHFLTAPIVWGIVGGVLP